MRLSIVAPAGLVALLFLALAPAQAQAPDPLAPVADPVQAAEPAPADPEATEPEPTEAEAADAEDTGSIDGELEARPDGFTYNPQGRRDPFVSLNRRIEGAGGPPRPAGIEGFLIQELALKGIVSTPEGYVSMLEGPDAKSYFVRVGQRLYDGSIIAMDDTTVTFLQDVTDPLSRVKTRELKKDLYPSEEATQ